MTFSLKCAGAFPPKVSAVLKKEWQYNDNQCQRSFLLSSNVDQSHSYLCPSPLLQWSCSHQRWQLWFCFKNISRSNFWWNCLPAMFRGRGRGAGEHQRRPYHRDQWACIQSQIWGGWYQSLVTFVTSVEGDHYKRQCVRFCGCIMTLVGALGSMLSQIRVRVTYFKLT